MVTLSGCDTTPQPTADLEGGSTSTEPLDHLFEEAFTPNEEDLQLREQVFGKWVLDDPEVWIEYKADGTFAGVLDSYVAPSIHKALEYSGQWQISLVQFNEKLFAISI